MYTSSAYDGDYVYGAGKHKVINDAMYQWTMPGEYYAMNQASVRRQSLVHLRKYGLLGYLRGRLQL
ncbi:hypothetical protein OSTOST_09006 [Ostertagia ostertagi]